jgi:phage terminase large subunit-like protein
MWLANLTPQEKVELTYRWSFWGRDNQHEPPGDWRFWLVDAGRGFGKTRTGAEWVRDRVERKLAGRIALIAETAADARDVMVEGESGILAISPPWSRPVYQPSKRRLQWPNGAIATTYSAEEPDQLRGPQHDAGWCDEIAKWRYGVETWANFDFGLRLGDRPQGVATTTPKPVKLVKQLLADPLTVVTHGSMFDNAANLPATTLASLRRTYEGTRLGRQELMGELLEDVEGAMWQRAWFDQQRATSFQITDDGPAVVRNGERGPGDHSRRRVGPDRYRGGGVR